MEIDIQRADGVETIALSRRPGTVSIVLIGMGVMLVLQIGVVLMTRPPGLLLMALLVMSAGFAGWLAIIALDSILPVSIKMDKDGIAVSKLLGSDQYPWTDVTAIKLVNSVGALSDDPSASASGRLAVGLFLKSRKTPRTHELDADIVLFGASTEHAHDLIKLIEHVAAFKATIGAGLPDPTRRIRKAAAIVQPTAFRRPRAAA